MDILFEKSYRKTDIPKLNTVLITKFPCGCTAMRKEKSENPRTALVGIINERSNNRTIKDETFGNFGSSKISGTHPDNFGRKAIENGYVKKVGVKSYDGKAVLFCIPPYIQITAVAQSHGTHLPTIGKTVRQQSQDTKRNIPVNLNSG
jgi:hypothetical protein